MPLAEKITRYSVSVLRNSFASTPDIPNFSRQIKLILESGGTASISFAETLPANFVRFFPNATSVFMTRDQFTEVYSVLQSESPVFFTASNLLGPFASVHTELNLDIGGETPGEGDKDPQSLEAVIRLARRLGRDHD